MEVSPGGALIWVCWPPLPSPLWGSNTFAPQAEARCSQDAGKTAGVGSQAPREHGWGSAFTPLLLSAPSLGSADVPLPQEHRHSPGGQNSRTRCSPRPPSAHSRGSFLGAGPGSPFIPGQPLRSLWVPATSGSQGPTEPSGAGRCGAGANIY